MKAKREQGIALITVLMILMLISAIAVGVYWMVMTDQRLGGNNLNRDLAFYGAEAGMEKLTADMGNQFAVEGALTGSDITTIVGKAPTTIPGITYTDANNNSTYKILCGSPAVTCTNPGASTVTTQVLPPSPYSGMNATVTPFVLQVTAQQTGGGEVKLQRNVQIVAIPVFQFGIYSDSDLAFFNGPSFEFGGRTHTNGNLWLAPNSGPLYLGDKVTVAGQIIRSNLENGYPQGGTLSSSTDYSGPVVIALTSNPPAPSSYPNSSSTPPYSNAQWYPLDVTQSSVTGHNVYGAVSTTANPQWGTIQHQFNNMVDKSPNTALSLTSTALGGITSPITLIQRPIVGEKASNAALFAQQYFSQGTLRILLDDYPTGTAPGGPAAPTNAACHSANVMSLDTVDTTADPFDLSRLAVANGSTPGWWAGGETFYPLPVSAATSGTNYTTSDGYWTTSSTAIVTGCLKIEYQDNTVTPTWHDITTTILETGYMGRNINPGSSTVSAPVPIVTLPTTGNQIKPQGPAAGVTTVGCADPNPNAIIRLARFRDNPDTAANANTLGHYCGATGTNHGYNFWPNALFDSREGTSRPGITTANDADGNPAIPLGGVMYYVELDATNLAKWLKNNQSVVANGLNNKTGFAVYFSDRRTERPDTTLATPILTGSYGYNDFVNPGDVNNGCPDGVMNAGENIEGDPATVTVPRLYGGVETLPYGVLSGIVNSGNLAVSGGGNVLVPNSNCATGTWPGLEFKHTRDARENSPIFFRRALKIVNGQTLNLGTSCFTGGVPACGLTISAENPVYIMGDYNVPGLSMTSGSSVATSVAGDAVTLLSDNWNDVNSFISPYDSGSRDAVQTLYRVALIGGKGIPFTQIGGTEDFGTDGGVHNFLRFLENWGSVNCYYGGSLVSFYYYHQAVGTYKNSGQVYSPPARIYNYDTNFSLGTQYLPPLTPTLRTINTTGFSQEINPNQ